MTARSQAEQTEAGLRESALRLDQALNARRLETPGLNWKTWARRATDAGYKLSYETLRAIRRGDYAPTPEVARAIEFMACWAPGSVENVRSGGDPTPLRSAGDDQATRPSKYDDPALQAVWDIELLPEDERRAAITAIRIVRENKQPAEQSDQRAYG